MLLVIVIDRQAKVRQVFGAGIRHIVHRAAANAVFYRKEAPQPPISASLSPTRAERFEGLVVPRCPLVAPLMVIHDSKYNKPWLLITDLHQQSAQDLFQINRCSLISLVAQSEFRTPLS